MRCWLPAAVAALLLLLTSRVVPAEGLLSWPIGCNPGVDCLGKSFLLGYPDIDRQGRTFECGTPPYTGHNGTDIYVTAVDDGVSVLAAADGEVIAAVDGRYDRCPDYAEPDCRPPEPERRALCGDLAAECNGDCNCLWGFDAGNFVLVRHRADPALALTLYAHLRKGSLAVSPGTQVRRGEILGQVGSSGNSTTPHLHFGFWRNVEGGGELTDPWGSRCGANRSRSYWEHDPPYLSGQANGQDDRHDGVPADQLRNTRLTVFPLTAEWN